mmetsp:Transcript_101231/g.163298  ORF Transcript_101231/g.163298 Transcript_101231/m.163298 type:complete len:187 (-) Transcript_101231:2259-2819(-)
MAKNLNSILSSQLNLVIRQPTEKTMGFKYNVSKFCLTFLLLFLLLLLVGVGKWSVCSVEVKPSVVRVEVKRSVVSLEVKRSVVSVEVKRNLDQSFACIKNGVSLVWDVSVGYSLYMRLYMDVMPLDGIIEGMAVDAIMTRDGIITRQGIIARQPIIMTSTACHLCLDLTLVTSMPLLTLIMHIQGR